MRRDLYQTINLSDLVVRLKELGWGQVSGDPALLRSPSGKVARIPFDLPEELRTSVLQEIFSELSDGDTLVSAADLVAQYVYAEDLVFVGVDLPHVDPGFLPLIHARDFYDSWLGFVRQAVAAESNYHKQGTKRLNGESQAFADRMRWGKTMSGSFMHAIHVPIDPSTEPFGRRFWHRIVRCMEALRIAIPENSVEALLMAESRGWNAPMCEKMAALIEDTSATAVKIDVRPDTTRKDMLFESPTNSFVDAGHSDAVGLLMDAAALLRDIPEEAEVEVFGRTFMLQDPDVAGVSAPKQIRLRWERGGESQPINITIELDEIDYEMAVNAHMRKVPVHMRGLLGRRGTKWVISDYSDFGPR